jgi:hypothetical protein
MVKNDLAGIRVFRGQSHLVPSDEIPRRPEVELPRLEHPEDIRRLLSRHDQPPVAAHLVEEVVLDRVPNGADPVRGEIVRTGDGDMPTDGTEEHQSGLHERAGPSVARIALRRPDDGEEDGAGVPGLPKSLGHRDEVDIGPGPIAPIVRKAASKCRRRSPEMFPRSR